MTWFEIVGGGFVVAEHVEQILLLHPVDEPRPVPLPRVVRQIIMMASLAGENTEKGHKQRNNERAPSIVQLL